MCHAFIGIGGMLFEGVSYLNGILKYFMTLVATALMGVLLTALIKDRRIQNIIKLLMGSLLLIVLLRPVAQIDMETLGEDLGNLFRDELSTSDYESLYYENLRQQIKKTTEEYIRKKGESLGAVISAEVELSTDDYPVPISVKLYGSITWEQRLSLQEYITRELGIPTEHQRWEIYG